MIVGPFTSYDSLSCVFQLVLCSVDFFVQIALDFELPGSRQPVCAVPVQLWIATLLICVLSVKLLFLRSNEKFCSGARQTLLNRIVTTLYTRLMTYQLLFPCAL